MKKNVLYIGGGLLAVLTSCGVGAAMGGGDTTTAHATDASATARATATVTETQQMPGQVITAPPKLVKITETPKPRVIKVTVTAKPKAPAKPTPKPQPTKAAVATGNPTAAQEQAIGTAQDYLQTAAFSRKGLIEQLTYEGYSANNAAYAVDYVHPNYMKQAAKAAKEYLHTSHFSHSGLVQQLEYEGYTSAQSEYGVRKAGL